MAKTTDIFQSLNQQKKQWNWLFLDLDNTLWDFDANAREALKELYRRHQLDLHCDWHVDAFVSLYQDVNASYWKRYERGEVDKETLRTARFSDTFERMGIPSAIQPVNVWQEYLEICPVMTVTMPGALDAIQLLSTKYSIALLTNGFEKTQNIKVDSNGMRPFVKFLQTSEQLGLAKPAAEFFEKALKTANIEPRQALYMGDNWETDVLGGCGAGITTFWYQNSAMRSGDRGTHFYENGDLNNTFLSNDALDDAIPEGILPRYGGRVWDWNGFAQWLMA